MSSLMRSPVPLYAQLEAALRESIRRGKWGPGDPLPSDRGLAEQWRVSRSTARQALDALVRDGLIERRQGKGTFVVSTETLRDFIGYYSFEGTKDKAIRFATRVLSFQPVDPPPSVCECLRVMAGVQVLRLRLLRLANETPAILLTSYMPAEAGSRLQEEDFLAFPVLTQVITNCCRIPVVSQRRSVQPVLIQGEEAALLEVRPGALGLHMERVSYTDFRQPVECGTTVVRCDLVRYSLDIAHAGRSVSQTLRYNDAPSSGQPDLDGH